MKKIMDDPPASTRKAGARRTLVKFAEGEKVAWREVVSRKKATRMDGRLPLGGHLPPTVVIYSGGWRDGRHQSQVDMIGRHARAASAGMILCAALALAGVAHMDDMEDTSVVESVISEVQVRPPTDLFEAASSSSKGSGGDKGGKKESSYHNSKSFKGDNGYKKSDSFDKADGDTWGHESHTSTGKKGGGEDGGSWKDSGTWASSHSSDDDDGGHGDYGGIGAHSHKISQGKGLFSYEDEEESEDASKDAAGSEEGDGGHGSFSEMYDSFLSKFDDDEEDDEEDEDEE
ncbi:keratin, type I cytoskeletal 9-like [Neocloeon triangulifer]|uniref:keratin, type I cytoskeletal 9-like n=1 Tax=Neocloeon triangulifer TaxID=2078957 RepID=UPI00286EF933|nr:keratin, type I cytoskeletal 9-like [Neocloeon triangulifer]